MHTGRTFNDSNEKKISSGKNKIKEGGDLEVKFLNEQYTDMISHSTVFFPPIPSHP